jgi:hypothetical protein
MNRYYTVHITPGTTSPGPYTIYWDTTIATIYPSGLPATGLTLNQLTGSTGVNVVVGDSTQIINLYNTYCNINQYINALPTDKLYDFCMNIVIPDVNTYNIHFNSNGLDSNGKHKWISDDSIYNIVWSTSLGKWELQTWPCYFDICPIISSSSVSYPPLDNWTIAGLSGTITVTKGNSCLTPKFLKTSLPVSVNQPKCSCDGNIIINAKSLSGGEPPYLFSIDNGLTYYSSPIFNNLCSGLYNVRVKDSYNDIFGNNVTLNAPVPPTTYTITLNTTNTILTNTTYNLTTEYTTSVVITPELPDGVLLNFDLIHTNNFKTSPTNTTSTLVTNTVLNKNGTPISLNHLGTSTGTTVNIIPGCQDLFVYQSGLTENWSSLSITNSDTIILTTTTTVIKNEITLCTVGESSESYSLLNANINGCDCCKIIII